MKTFLSALAITLFCTPLVAQLEFAPVGAVYYYLGETHVGPSTGPFIINYYVFEVEVIGDTLIQGQSSRILREANGSNNWMWPCTDDQKEVYMYEDAGEVFYLNQATDTFDLLYDFNAVEGDSWQVPAYCDDGSECNQFDEDFTVQVDLVEQVQLNGESIKVQHVSLHDAFGVFNYSRIYEGIGSLEHMFFEKQWGCLAAHDYFRGLRCYSSPTEGTFSFYDDTGTCDMVVGTEERIDDNIAIDVFPNPTIDHINVKVESLFSWEMYDVKGALVASNERKSYQVNIDMEKLITGVYFLKIRIDDRVTVRKIIKN